MLPSTNNNYTGIVQSPEDVQLYQETIRELYKLLCDAWQERDEAKEQLQRSATEISQLKTLLNKVLSTAQHQTPQLSSGSTSTGASCNNFTDRASMMIESLVRGRELPKKGKLVQAVMEAGQLLETLMVTGPLPKWRNPPPHLLQPMPSFELVGDHYCSTSSSVV